VFKDATVPDACPQCSSPGEVVTAVTVSTMGTDPRTILVTRQCVTAGCHHKYVVLKPESDLTPEERKRWRNP
jgi:hypothetical protein